jgi:N-acetylglucosamine-6-phosphate deacetylase
MAFALTGCRIFTGTEFLDDHAVLISGRKIEKVVERSEIPQGQNIVDLKGGILAPGFIDVQVNGGGGALLNETPTVETVKRIADAHRKFGTTGLLPTVITDVPEILSQAMNAVQSARKELPNVLGLHVEGPFIDVAKKGAHDARFIRPMTSADVAQITAADCGIVMVTVAPNVVEPQFIQELTKAGVLVSLGHSGASFAQANAALTSGASAFTHLFNAMSQMNGREPGMVGAALSDTKSFIGIIADGFHVDDAVLKIALAASSHDRFMLISDAMPSAAGGPRNFSLQARTVNLKDGRLTLPDGTLAGSNLTMDEALRYSVKRLGVSLAHGLRMASLNPARFLRVDHELGRIAAGCLASMVHLDQSLHVQKTWVEGI